MKFKSNSVRLAKPLGEMTLPELYMELDGIHWGWKLAASVANWMMLAGFIVLPSAFDDEGSKFRLSSVALRAVAAALLLVGYLITGVLCWYFKNILFQVEAIFIPGFTGSLLGMMSSLFNVYGKIHDPGDPQWGGTAISAFTLSTVFVVFYGTTAWNGNRKIDLIRQHDINMAMLQEQLEDPSLIPVEEHTRRQLLKLLLADQHQHSFAQDSVEVPQAVYDPREQPMGYSWQSGYGRMGTREDRSIWVDRGVGENIGVWGDRGMSDSREVRGDRELEEGRLSDDRAVGQDRESREDRGLIENTGLREDRRMSDDRRLWEGRSLREDRGLREGGSMGMSGVVMSATVGHAGERAGGTWWWSPV